MHKCPQCGRLNTRRSRRPFDEQSLSSRFILWFRCRDCGARFQGTDWARALKWSVFGMLCVGVITASLQWRHDPHGAPPPEADLEAFSALSQNPFTSTTMEVGGSVPVALREAAASGDPEAQYQLGLALLQEHRKYGNRDAFTQAMQLLHDTAAQGHVRAQVKLGTMYEKGRGVIQDFVEATKWFRKAAEQGEADALYHLGLMAAEGKGSPKDFVQAYVWFNLAAAQGEVQAELARNRIRASLSDAEIAEAQERSRLLNQKLPVQ